MGDMTAKEEAAAVVGLLFLLQNDDEEEDNEEEERDFGMCCLCLEWVGVVDWREEELEETVRDGLARVLLLLVGEDASSVVDFVGFRDCRWEDCRWVAVVVTTKSPE